MQAMQTCNAVAHLQNVQSILSGLTILDLYGFLYPKPARVKDDDSFDFIIVGTGSAGCVVANQLIEQGIYKVLLIEAGGSPPLETHLPGLYLYLKRSKIDWNFTSTCDSRTMWNHRNHAVELTQGKMLGGTGSLNYAGYLRGNPYDYDRWANLTNDGNWCWKSVLPTFKKNEKLIDNKILTSNAKCFYGTKGKIKIRKQYFKRNIDYFAAFRELGWKTPIDINPDTPLGFNDVMYNIGDGERQSPVRDFISPIKDDPNLHVMTNTHANKIIFDNEKRAIGVEVTTSDNKVLVLKAKKEVIVCAGAIKSPQLLMLSGIGPKNHLESKGIKVIADLPVGQNFQDHVNAHLVYKLPKAKRAAKVRDPRRYPFALFDGYLALNQSQKKPDYEVIGVSLGQKEIFLQFCGFFFNFKWKFCDTISKKLGNSEILFILLTYLYPKSRGQTLLGNKDPKTYPIITPGYYTNEVDITNHAKYCKDFNRILETSYFKSVQAELVLPKVKQWENITEGSDEFWKHYAVGTSDTSYYYVGTCGMGPVLNSRLEVLEVKGLRVIDSSSFPDTVGAPIQPAVIMLAQKGVQFIIQDHANNKDT